jgi:hypothetical protein
MDRTIQLSETNGGAGAARRLRWGTYLALGLATLFAGSASATPLISEVFYDATGSDDGLGFVELYGEPGTVLDGLVIEGINGSNGAAGPVIELVGVIPADGLFVLADHTSANTTEVIEADATANFDFQNGPDSIVLRDGDTVLDAVGYGVFGAGEVFAGEGMPAEDPPAGWSLARYFADVDTDDNAMDFVALDVPTPGVAEMSAVPEPGSGLLAGTGMFVLGWVRRRALRRRGFRR